MRSRHVAPLVILGAWLALVRSDAAPPARIVAIGDVHGADVAFAAILQRALANNTKLLEQLTSGMGGGEKTARTKDIAQILAK